MAERLCEPFPWLEFLTPEDRDRFASEVVEVSRACAAVSRFDRMLLTLNAWYSSAQAIAAGYVHDEDLEWLPIPTPVSDPRTT